MYQLLTCPAANVVMSPCRWHLPVPLFYAQEELYLFLHWLLWSSYRYFQGSSSVQSFHVKVQSILIPRYSLVIFVAKTHFPAVSMHYCYMLEVVELGSQFRVIDSQFGNVRCGERPEIGVAMSKPRTDIEWNSIRSNQVPY